MNEKHPSILLLATGGTIASTSNPAGRKDYTPGPGDADAMLALVAQAGAVNITAQQVAAIGSQDMSEVLWRRLATGVRQAFAAGADAVIITHGTDTLEETAFFLDLVISRRTCVILVGAMRSANVVGADGPRNLICATRVALDSRAYGRGVLTVLNDEVHGARQLQKTATSGVGAIQSGPRGPIATVTPSNVHWYEPACPAGLSGHFALPESPLPLVEIIYGYAGVDSGLVDMMIERGTAGLVLAGVGAGNASDAVLKALARAAARGIIVVRSTRIAGGFVERNAEVDDDELGLVAACDLSPHKSRILVQLAIASGVTDPADIQRLFNLS